MGLMEGRNNHKHLYHTNLRRSVRAGPAVKLLPKKLLSQFLDQFRDADHLVG
jgi:hypothetical protein